MKIFGSNYLIGAILITYCACGTAKKEKDVEVTFKKHVLLDEFISEGVNVGDVNKDGQMDILAGPLWFEAPDWKSHEIFPVGDYDYTKGYSDSFLNYTLDVNKDGWIDFICFDFPGKEVYWFENPKNQEGHWKKYVIDSSASNESPMLADINMDGFKELVFGDKENKRMVAYSEPTKAGEEWKSFPISEENVGSVKQFSHGLGFGDINSDGRNDVIITDGWWEAPEDYSQFPWEFHKADLGKACSQMYAYDFDDDGDSDVFSTSAHEFGVWWHEQVGESTFETHLIDSSFSETHAIVFTDMNGDDLPDVITGKRYFSHQGHGPGGMMTPYLYWFELQRDENNQPKWIRHQIDDDSGVGIQFVVEDMNNDGKKDIVIANKKGVFFFENTTGGA